MNEAWLMITYDNKTVTVEFEVTLDKAVEQIVSTAFTARNLNIKTVRVTPVDACNAEITILSKADELLAEAVYQNDSTHSTGDKTLGIYDNVDILYKDDDDTSKLHCKIKNIGDVSTTFKVKITSLSVR